MFNIYAVHDMYMFNVPSAKLSHIHIVPKYVVWTQYILHSYVTRLSLVKLQIKHQMLCTLLNMPTFVV